MTGRIRSKLTYANVMATIAVFLALGGGIAWALANNSVKSRHIKDGQVKPEDLSDSAESFGFRYETTTGGGAPVDILDVGDYRITAACESVSGRPSVEFFIDFPEDGRLAGHGTSQSSGPGDPLSTAGPGVNVDGDVTFDGGAVTAPMSELTAFGTTLTYVGQTKAATFNIHFLADDDTDLCRINGMLTPGTVAAG